MNEYFLTCLLMSVFIQQSTSQPVFECPKHVFYGDSANLTCSNIETFVVISNPQGHPVANCNDNGCGSGTERVDIRKDRNRILLTVHEINKEDEGGWTCQSPDVAKCFLNIRKLPSCVINSSESTNDLTIGQDLTLNINLSDYYCTNSIAWNLRIGGKSQNISEFREVEETNNITSRAVTYSPTVTSSLTGHVELTFNCNDETYDVSCSGVDELKLRDPPSCTLTSDDNTDALTIGNNLTLKAAIEDYRCKPGIEYALLSGSVMITDFLKSDKMYYAKFEVKQEYLDNQLHLKYTCNNVSETTGTEGVTILHTKGSQLMSCNYLGLIIGLSVGSCFVIVVIIIIIIVIIIIIIITVIICRNKRKKMSRKNDAVYSDVRDKIPQRKSSLTSNETYAEVSDANNRNHVANVDTKGNRIELTHFTGGWDKSRPRSVCEMVENVAYESVDKIKLKPK